MAAQRTGVRGLRGGRCRQRGKPSHPPRHPTQTLTSIGCRPHQQGRMRCRQDRTGAGVRREPAVHAVGAQARRQGGVYRWQPPSTAEHGPESFSQFQVPPPLFPCCFGPTCSAPDAFQDRVTLGTTPPPPLTHPPNDCMANVQPNEGIRGHWGVHWHRFWVVLDVAPILLVGMPVVRVTSSGHTRRRMSGRVQKWFTGGQPHRVWWCR